MKLNYNFGTLTEGVIAYATKPITVGGTKFWTNSEALYREAGYFPVVRTQMPQREGYYYTSSWKQEGEPALIVEHFTEHAEEAEQE